MAMRITANEDGEWLRLKNDEREISSTSQTSQTLREYFDRVAAGYRRAIHWSAGERIVKLACPGAGEIVLDVGTGPGLVYRSLASKVQLAIAVDISLNMLHELRKLTKQPNCVLADVLHLPFRDRCFNKVVSNEFWIHMLTAEEQKNSLGGMARVLRLEGKAVVGGVRNASPLRSIMPGVVLWCSKRFILAAKRGRAQEIVDALREIDHFARGHGMTSGSSRFLPSFRLTVYTFTPSEIFQLFEAANLRISKIVGREGLFRVPVISQISDPTLGHFLIDIVAERPSVTVAHHMKSGA